MAVLAPISGMPQFRNGKLVADAVAYFYDAGTTTDRAVYEAASGSEHVQPVEVTGAGNFPAIYIQGSNPYKIRIEDGDGALIIEYDDLQGEVSTVDGGGGGGTTIPTGFEMHAYATGAVTGWVRENGRTIGSASSGATERANADTEALFLHLWETDANLAVSGGRFGTAADDWNANKTIALPDAMGRVLVGVDGMGGSGAGRMDSGLFLFGNTSTMGSYGGDDAQALTEANLAPHIHGGSAAADGNHNHGGVTGTTDPAATYERRNSYTTAQTGSTNSVWQDSATVAVAGDSHNHTIPDSGTHTHAITIASTGSGTAHNNMQPFTLRTIYIKL